MGRLLDTNPSHYFFEEGIKSGFMVYEQFLLTEGTTQGHIYIGDATGLTFGHIFRIKPTLLSKLAYYVQEALPIRLKAVHIINTSPLMGIIFNMMKPFIRKEMMKVVKSLF